MILHHSQDWLSRAPAASLLVKDRLFWHLLSVPFSANTVVTATLSKTQIDKLGERLRKGPPIEAVDIELLDEYRRSFSGPYETVIRTIREKLHLEPSGRPAKSTGAILDKLRGESIRLSQVQDIAGCRLVVPEASDQDQVVGSPREVFPGARIIDRRKKPSAGYRAVHVIVKISGKLIEIQVRSSLQHFWAELSEKYADVVDPAIKYGGGPEELRLVLENISSTVERYEWLQIHLAQVRASDLGGKYLKHIQELEQQLSDSTKALTSIFVEAAMVSASFGRE